MHLILVHVPEDVAQERRACLRTPVLETLGRELCTAVRADPVAEAASPMSQHQRRHRADAFALADRTPLPLVESRRQDR
jgi:hypothetical protein